MREIANWGQELADDEWISKIGIWYTPAWKYGDLSSLFGNEAARAIDDFHHDLFVMLCDSDEGDPEFERMARIDGARLSAIEAASNSDAFHDIVKTQDFAAYIAGDDGIDYKTKKPIGA